MALISGLYEIHVNFKQMWKRHVSLILKTNAVSSLFLSSVI